MDDNENSNTVRAVVTYVDELDGSELVEVSGHRFQMGGQGDGYCYKHQSFDCLDRITDVEREAIKNATYSS